MRGEVKVEKERRRTKTYGGVKGGGRQDEGRSHLLPGGEEGWRTLAHIHKHRTHKPNHATRRRERGGGECEGVGVRGTGQRE